MKKILFLTIGLLISTNTYAQETYRLSHPKWEDTITVKNNRFCRTNKDCATILHKDKTSLTIKWDKYSKEKFSYNEFEQKWILIPNFYARETLMKEYEEMEYTFQEPYIKLNPFHKTPISALVKFPTQKPSQIHITIKGKNNAPDITHTFKEFKTEHELPILGLYPNYNNQVLF